MWQNAPVADRAALLEEGELSLTRLSSLCTEVLKVLESTLNPKRYTP